MDDKEHELRHNPRVLCQALFIRATRWLTAALLCKIGVFALGALVVLLAFIPKSAPFLVAALSIIAEICLWRSEKNKGTAEALLRKLDMRDAFGWPISKGEMSDLLLRVPAKLRKKLSPEGLGEQYFASKETAGAKRAVENTQESAWWSKHLAEKMGHYCLTITCVLAVGSVVLLVVSIETVRDFDTLSSIGRTVTSTISFLFSLGLLRLAMGYYSFSRKAAQIEDQAESLLSSERIDAIQAIKIAHEYQLARMTAPLIPSWIWKRKRDDLNELWATYRTRSQTGNVG
jgi:hypothetical protein